MTDSVFLHEICDVISAKTPHFDGIKQYIATGDVDVSVIVSSTPVSFDNKPSRAKIAAEEGDILVAKMADTCKVVDVNSINSNYIFSTGFAQLRPKSGVIYPRYLFHMLADNRFQAEKNRQSSGSTQKAIVDKRLKKLKIPYFPIQQQIAISNILDRLKSLDKSVQENNKYREAFIFAVFSDFFGDTRTNPKNWEKRTLDSIVKSDTIITRGIDQPGPHAENGVPFIRPSDFGKGITRNELSRCIPEIEKKYPRSKLSENDIVITIRATVGSVLFVKKEFAGCNLSRGTARISPGPLINPIYLYYCLQSNGIKTNIAEKITGTTFLQISLAELRKILIPIPPRTLQDKFAIVAKIISNSEYGEMINNSEMSIKSFSQEVWK